MPKVRSILTLSNISDDHGRVWTNLEKPIRSGKLGRHVLKVVGAESLRVDSSGTMLYLDGLTYRGSAAHLTLTGDDSGDWTYFHFTVGGRNGASAYYALEEKDGDLTVDGSSLTVIDGSKKDVSKSQHFWRDVPGDLTDDVRAIVTSLVAKRYKEGEAS